MTGDDRRSQLSRHRSVGVAAGEVRIVGGGEGAVVLHSAGADPHAASAARATAAALLAAPG